MHNVTCRVQQSWSLILGPLQYIAWHHSGEELGNNQVWPFTYESLQLENVGARQIVRMTWACRFKIREAKEAKKALNGWNVDFRIGLSIGVRKWGKSLSCQPSLKTLSEARPENISECTKSEQDWTRFVIVIILLSLLNPFWALVFYPYAEYRNFFLSRARECWILNVITDPR